jgi:hypothetical protein
MNVSPVTLYGGAANIMAADLASMPERRLLLANNGSYGPKLANKKQLAAFKPLLDS